MKAKHLMTQRVISINKDATIAEAARRMKQSGVGSIAVEDNGNFVGIITDRDIVLRDIAESDNPGKMKCSDIMTTNVSSATPDSNLNDIAQIMSDKQVKRVPIVEENRLVGMISLGDVSQAQGKENVASEALRDITTKQTFS